MIRVVNLVWLIFLPFMAIAQQKNVELIDVWTDTNIANGQEDARYNDLWPFQQNNENYCVIGSTIGHHICKVNLTGLEFVDFKPGAYQNSTVVHRDYKTYRNYLYAVCDEGQSSLQVYDLSTLPDSMSLVYEDDITFETCHNIFIDTASAKLYACGPNDAGMKIFSLEDPEQPTLIYDFNQVDYVHDCYVRNDTAFLNCGFDGLQVFYFGGSIPIQIGLLDFYPNQGYNHSGWLSPDGTNYVFIDETEGTKINACNVHDLAQIQINEQYVTPNYFDNVPHNVVVLNNLVFVAYHKEGLRVFNNADQPPREIAYYDTYSIDSDYKLNGAWGVGVFPEQNQILISDRQSGLFLFEFPIMTLEEDISGSVVTSSPFIDENSMLITKDNFLEDDLYFSIAAVNGQLVYSEESYKNWIKIPLDLAPGIYIYSVFDKDQQLVDSGKFVKSTSSQ